MENTKKKQMTKAGIMTKTLAMALGPLIKRIFFRTHD